MNILIISEAHDIHAAAVRWGLAQLGCEALQWQWSDFPRIDRAAWRLGPERAPRLDLLLGERALATPCSALWYRRPGKPTPRAASHPDDHAVIRSEAMAWLRNSAPLLGDGSTRWVNHPDAAERAERKLDQLIAAKEVGFRIPDTLAGNDIDAVRRFFIEHQGQIIYKAFAPNVWEEADGKITFMRAAALDGAHLESAEPVLACPGIFQQRIRAAYELRVTVIGETVIAAAIDSQQDGASVDWRFSGKLGQVPLRAVTLDAGTAARCVALCRRLGLAFGCIDLIVTRAGETVFLEVNQAGQFIWKERMLPELALLDTFCRLLAGDQARADGVLRLADFYLSDAYRAYRAERPVTG